MTSYHNGRVTVWHGDCRDVLAGFEPDSFDACVTDPPYGLQFMGREWDKLWRNGTKADAAYIERTKGELTSRARKLPDYSAMARGPQMEEFHRQWAEQVYRVLKPGAHLVAFSSTRTYHRMVCGIEDAGFEIRDACLYLYGSGFPKSLDVSKAIDKEAGHWRGRAGAITIAEQPAKGTKYERTDKGDPITAEAQQWQGWGTALKPSVEPICLARKPLARGKTIADNVMEWGTGALNIDACRVDGAPSGLKPYVRNVEQRESQAANHKNVTFTDHPLGRWPANCLHDGSPEVVAGFPESESIGGTGLATTNYKLSKNDTRQRYYNFGDSGSAARFFYTAKADADDRLGSRHPTVKPLDLIQWLCRLITPPKGHILDCFAGTGTTAEAALREGFRCTLIEREPEYLADIDRRMALAFEGSTGRSVAMAKLKPEGEPLPLFAEAAE